MQDQVLVQDQVRDIICLRDDIIVHIANLLKITNNVLVFLAVKVILLEWNCVFNLHNYDDVAKPIVLNIKQLLCKTENTK